jgi:hypothetical protein
MNVHVTGTLTQIILMALNSELFIWIEHNFFIDDDHDIENEVMEDMRDCDYLSNADTESHCGSEFGSD